MSSFRPLATSLPLPLASLLDCSPAVSARSATPSDLSRSSTLWSVNGVTDSALSRQRDLSQSPTSNVPIDSTLHTTARRHLHQILEYTQTKRWSDRTRSGSQVRGHSTSCSSA
ncbi:hypothetical protein C8Q70DRAFT_991401 [Cubamyces menziesii]|nr:hypothetical protein C8Q70DRAFT_991401 [Cubamyces menziesii]